VFHKQPTIHVGKRRLLGIKLKQRQLRYYKKIGLGYKTPREAIEGTYVDRKCPFTSDVSIRGRILRGTVISAGKMRRTVIVRRNYLHYIPKYKRYEKRHNHTAAHVSPAFEVREGDKVVIGECRPLSKTVRFNVIRLDTTNKGRKQFKSF